jgi:ABC-type polysaccharide/polyol phosphate export permease
MNMPDAGLDLVLPGLWRGVKVQARVLRALMIRELMMRYGRGNIGFLWLVLEPMLLCAASSGCDG